MDAFGLFGARRVNSSLQMIHSQKRGTQLNTKSFMNRKLVCVSDDFVFLSTKHYIFGMFFAKDMLYNSSSAFDCNYTIQWNSQRSHFFGFWVGLLVQRSI